MTLESQIQLSTLAVPKPLIDELKAHLTITNPAFVKAAQLQLFKLPPKSLYYYVIKNNTMTIPIGVGGYLLKLLDKYSLEYNIVENRSDHPLDIDYTTNFELRDYQQHAVSAFSGRTVGTLVSPTGSGKTMIIIELIKEVSQRSLVLVTTIELANQFRNRLIASTNLTKEDIGFIGSGVYDIKPVTVGILQSVRKMNDAKVQEINNYFGAIYFDEVHQVPAHTYCETMSRLSMKYKLGFSATLERGDGLMPVIFFVTGPIFTTVAVEDVGTHRLKPTVSFLETSFTFPYLNIEDYVYLINDLAIDEVRNKLIVDTYKGMENYADHQTIFLCARISQTFKLWDILGRTGGVLISGASEDNLTCSKEDLKLYRKFATKKSRIETIKKLETGELNHVFSTPGLFATGIDLPNLEWLFICGPLKSKILLPQACGRLVRPRKDDVEKKPQVICLIDKDVEVLRNSSYTTKRTLLKLCDKP